MIGVVIDGDPVTHCMRTPRRGDWLLVTRCWIWFVERGHPLDDLEGRLVDDPVDCMTCLVVEARL